MQTQLGRFNSETLQVPAKSHSNSRVTNGLIRGNKLARALPFRNRLEIKSLESGCILNITKHLLSNSTGHTELDNCKITTSSPLRSWSFLLFKTLMIMKPPLKEISLLLTLDTSSNLKKPAEDKTYMETLRNFTGLSKSDLIIMSWIKRAEIGSLRLMTLVPRTLLDVVLTASAIGSSVGEGIPAKSQAHLKP